MIDSHSSSHLESPLEHWEQMGAALGVDLWVKRDDLLPFPLAGNKVRKLSHEAELNQWRSGDVLITNGSVTSNHCRTLAFIAARLGAHAHFVMHSEGGSPPEAYRLIRATGATWEVVDDPALIGARLEGSRRTYESRGSRVHVVAGGCHTPAGVQAYVAAGHQVCSLTNPDHIVLASGTGATQAGLHIAALSYSTQVTGISVARSSDRGRRAVAEAVDWIDRNASATVVFDDRFRDGGYGAASEQTHSIVRWAWAQGLPLDPTYTGKAMRGLIELIEEGAIRRGQRVVFWHTGGLMNYILSAPNTPLDDLSNNER